MITYWPNLKRGGMLPYWKHVEHLAIKDGKLYYIYKNGTIHIAADGCGISAAEMEERVRRNQFTVKDMPEEFALKVHNNYKK